MDRFVNDLGNALSKDLSEIRETQLEHAGGYEWVNLHFKDGTQEKAQLFVDRLRRLVVPVDEQWDELEGVSFDSERHAFVQKVLRKELRYAGDEPSDVVIYLENPEVNRAGVA